jgi:PadR family transcriptional regulator, regulatory protein AphA
MLRLLFAEQGDLEQLRGALHTIAKQTRSRRVQFAAMAKGILDTGGEFPRRLHVNALGMRFMIDHYDQINAWTNWALANIQTWDDTTTAATTWAGPARQILSDAADFTGSPSHDTSAGQR